MGKWPALRARYPDVTLHLIGPLQTNKVKEAVELFDVIETVDRPKLAEALAAEIKKSGKAPKLYVEVNTGAEPQKRACCRKRRMPSSRIVASVWACKLRA